MVDHDSAKWVMVKHSKKDKVAVYIDKSKNNSSGVYSWKTTFTIAAPLEVVTDEYMEHMTEMQAIVEPLIQRTEIFDSKQIDANTREYFTYIVTKFPAPFKDRELVGVNRWMLEKDRALLVAFSVQHPKFPANKKYVRMINHRADLELTRVGDETHVSLFACVDLKGNFPRWMSKTFASSYIKSAKKTREYFKQLKRGVAVGDIVVKDDSSDKLQIDGDQTKSAESEELDLLEEFLEMNGLKKNKKNIKKAKKHVSQEKSKSTDKTSRESKD